MLLLNEEEIRLVITMEEVIEADKRAFQLIGTGGQAAAQLEAMLVARQLK